MTDFSTRLRVLGLETSCDETGVAVYDTVSGLLAHKLYSQTQIHARYGGVVPELASRDHIRKTLPLIRQTLADASLSLADIDGIAYTAGPGLIGALMVGAGIGRALAWSLGIPAVAVHHMEGHLLAPMLEDPQPAFPFVALLVSGGHTMLVQVDAVGHYRILGESVDDAVGEAFDKTAKLLGLPYPGGPELARLAAKGRAGVYRFPRPMTNRPGLDFSYSGLKTFALNTLREAESEEGRVSEQTRADIAFAFQEAAVDSLVIKCRRALEQTGIRTLVIAGGVSANACLRSALHDLARQQAIALYFPRLEFCTDNGAMIAYAGSLRLAHGQSEEAVISAQPRWQLDSLPPLTGKS